MTWLDRLFLSPWFWTFRLVTTAISIFLIWRVTIMTTSVVLYTPAEYLPILVVIGLVFTGLLTMLRGKTEYNDYCKEGLRSGAITEVPGYGMDYLASNLGTIVIGVVGSFLIPGIVYEAIGAAPNMAGCLAIAIVWSIIVGIKGAKTMTEVVDLFRDKVKIADLTKKKTE